MRRLKHKGVTLGNSERNDTIRTDSVVENTTLKVGHSRIELVWTHSVDG